MNASADDYECPTIVTDKSHGACGQSRFGCWTCTVVKEDKSLTALVANGEEWLRPLLRFREELFNGRNLSKNRLSTRRNGQIAVSNDGHNQGTYTPEYRIKLLEKLLMAQREVQFERSDIELINNQELVAIQIVWNRDELYKEDVKFLRTVSEIYNNIYDKKIEMEKHTQKMQRELDLLAKVCSDDKSDYELIRELLGLQRNKALLNRKRGLKDDMERVIEKYINKKVG